MGLGLDLRVGGGIEHLTVLITWFQSPSREHVENFPKIVKTLGSREGGGRSFS